VVLDLDVPRELVLERISSRRVCRDCGTNFVVGQIERGGPICEVCGGEVEQRDDDTPDAINRRLDLYEEQTAPLIEFYGRNGRLAVIDGVGSPDEVFRRLTGAVDVARRAG
jgi:adenylate kinase